MKPDELIFAWANGFAAMGFLTSSDLIGMTIHLVGFGLTGLGWIGAASRGGKQP